MARGRIVSLDLLRGLVMVIMALDHVRDFFHIGMFTGDPTDLATTTPALFFTRWITHFCAPIFVFLAGTSAYLVRVRKGPKSVSRLLLTRGMWLVLIEVVVVRFGWQFNFGFEMIFLQVIWAIGVGMVVLALLVFLPRTVVMWLGLGIIVLHPVLYPISFDGDSIGAILFYALHQGGVLPISEDVIVFFAYPLLPWFGVIMAGYGMGVLYTEIISIEVRRKWLLRAGLGVVALFLALRVPNLYGEPSLWSEQGAFAYTAMSILDCTKYPPSLLYLCMTLGPALLFLYWADGRNFLWQAPVVVFGRVPFFFYILHIYLIHTLAMIAMVASGHPWRLGIITSSSFEDPAYERIGYDLWVVYAVWVAVVVMLYPLCRRFAAYRQRHTWWWLSYL